MRVGTRMRRLSVWSLIMDHPHACGDKIIGATGSQTVAGSSPCVWGQVDCITDFDDGSRIIPMRVGTRIL